VSQPDLPVGEVRADLVIDNKGTAAEVRKELEEVGTVADDELGKAGESGGKEFDRGIKKSTKNTGRDVARQVTDGIEREGIRLLPSKVTTELDRNNNVVRRWVTETVDNTVREINSAASSGGFDKVGETFTSAIGAGFNVSGKSPLIALLVPVIGIIGELVGAAVQAVGALSSLVFIIPSLIGGAIAQIGVLMVAFQGLGAAIQGAFQAKNADELNKALENLTPSAQEFVRSLLPLKYAWMGIRDLVQESFFKSFGSTLSDIISVGKPLYNLLTNILPPLSATLGRTLSLLFQFFASGSFINFINTLIYLTDKWLGSFAVSLYTLLDGLARIGTATAPFLEWFGGVFNAGITEFGEWLQTLANDKGFLVWLGDVKEDLAAVWEVLKAAGYFLFQFIKNLDEAGGQNFLKELAKQLVMLAEFFDSDIGRKALEGLINGIIALSRAFVGLVIIISSIIALLQFLAEVIGWFFSEEGFKAVGQDILGFFTMIGKAILAFFSFIGEAITNFLTETVPKFLSDVGNAAAEGVTALWNFITDIVVGIATGIYRVGGMIAQFFRAQGEAIWGFVQDIINAVANAFSNIWNTLYQAGRNMLDAVIAGIRSMFGPLADIAGQAVGIFRNFLPFSPAKEGPLSGSGDPMIAGQKIVQRLATGIEMEAPILSDASANAVSNVNMGAGAVQMNFYGPTPSAAQAAAVGGAAGNSLADTLAARNTRLAVRTLGAVG
jgi:hypothetical protein